MHAEQKEKKLLTEFFFWGWYSSFNYIKTKIVNEVNGRKLKKNLYMSSAKRQLVYSSSRNAAMEILNNFRIMI